MLKPVSISLASAKTGLILWIAIKFLAIFFWKQKLVGPPIFDSLLPFVDNCTFTLFLITLTFHYFPIDTVIHLFKEIFSNAVFLFLTVSILLLILKSIYIFSQPHCLNFKTLSLLISFLMINVIVSFYNKEHI